MRIAIVHYSFPPVVGGVETVASQHAALFAAHGHEVTVICKRGGDDLTRCQWIPYPAGASEAELTDLLLPVLADRAIVFLHNVATMPFDLALTAALQRLADALPSVRFVCWIHDLAAANPDYSSPPQLLTAPHPRFEYVAVSERRARQWEELSDTASGSCRIIPNGVDLAVTLGFGEKFASWEREHGLLARDFVLLQPVRLVRRKNVELGLRVAAAIKDAGRSTAYLITAAADPHLAASADYAAELRALRAALGLEADAFFAQESFDVAASDLPQFYAAADALFFPSRQEGFGLPMLEAALHRLPIFCADIEPLRSLPDQGVTRFSLDAEPAQIAAGLMRQLDASPAIQARKAVARKFAWPAVYRNFLAPLLSEVVTPPAA